MDHINKGQNKAKGSKGEDIAVKLLQDKGYTILDRNWTFGRKELDIIALDGEVLVIVEVKSRTPDRYENPADSITDGKIRNILEATEAYIFQKGIDRNVRFDYISNIFFGDHIQTDHITGAFIPMVE